MFGDAAGDVPARDQRSAVLAELSHLDVLAAGNESGSNESASNPRLSRWFPTGAIHNMLAGYSRIGDARIALARLGPPSSGPAEGQVRDRLKSLLLRPFGTESTKTKTPYVYTGCAQGGH